MAHRNPYATSFGERLKTLNELSITISRYPDGKVR